MRRAKQTSIILTSAALVAGVLSAAGPARAAVTAATGIPIIIENSGKCLNVAGGSTANNAKVIQFTCVPTVTNDKWVVVPKGNDLYWIQNVGSGKCLTVQNASTANSAPLIQYTCTTGANETWYIESQYERPTMRIISAGSGRCLNVPGASTANSVQLIQFTCQAGDGTPNERVIMPPTTSAAVVHRPFTSKQPVAAIQGGVPAGGTTAPVAYSWIDGTNQWNLATDKNPDSTTGASKSGASKSGSAAKGSGRSLASASSAAADPVPYGYTGRPEMALLADKRIEVVVHDAASGDVQYADESTTGTGDYPYYYDIGGTMSGQPTVGAYAPGQLAMYGIVDGQLWYDREAAGNLQSPIGGWRSLGGTGLTGAPASVPNGSGAQVFAATTAGQIQTATLSGTTLGDWTNLGGTGLGDPDVVALRSGKAFVTARAGDGSVVYKEQQADGTWPADWSTIAGVLAAGNPSAVVGSADGKLDVVIRGTDNLVYAAQETATGSGAFSGWVQISDPTNQPGTIALSDPTAFALTRSAGQSFGVVFQNADTDTNGPFVIYFTPSFSPTTPAASVARAAKSRVGLQYRALGKSKSPARLSAKK